MTSVPQQLEHWRLHREIVREVALDLDVILELGRRQRGGETALDTLRRVLAEKKAIKPDAA